jgi:Holliday junction DNA helicase RuvA
MTMISAITGELRRVDDDRVQVRVGALVYELLVPAADLTELQASLGEELTFHTLLYIEGDPNRGNLEPRMIGFLRAEDRKFFNRFTTVKGIGVRTALRALTVPVAEIAAAVESKNSRFLVGLNGIGRRTSELIIAELSGRLKEFVIGSMDVSTARSRRYSAEEEAALAFAVSPQMGLRRADAERLLERARANNPDATTAEQLFPEMIRLHSAK